jgi:glycosyltransferase involved in cell wall biosynthesis
MSERHRYVVVPASLSGYGLIETHELAGFTERHHFRLPGDISYWTSNLAVEQIAAQRRCNGVIVVLEHGLPGRRQLKLLSRLVSRGLRAFLAWPHESAIELIDRERLGSLRRHWIALSIGYRLKAWRERRAARTASPTNTTGESRAVAATAWGAFCEEASGLRQHLSDGIRRLGAINSPEALPLVHHFEGGLGILDRIQQQAAQISGALETRGAADQPSPAGGRAYGARALPGVAAFLRSIAEDPRPVPFPSSTFPTPDHPLDATGVYLRLDFWASPTSGGSYGHTCYQATALSETTRDLVCLMANRFELLDDLGVRQVTLPALDLTQTEVNILGMNEHYANLCGPLLDAMRPGFIFERLVLGSAVGAWASRRLNIPYIAEYNGSEISMRRSFAGRGYAHEELLRLAEDAAFRQAALISVVSDHVADEVARRGIPRSRILVNPNAADTSAYAPPSPEERHRLRASLGFEPHHRVVGFIGTFGGWHGVEVLAAALPAIVAGDASVRILLIGDGNLKHLVQAAVARNRIEDRVVDVGRVPQAKGAQLLKACDILVSPHARNMVDGPFFGSPTKLFEYMAMGAGIVASDLEQISHVLSPALRTADFATARASGGKVVVGDQRAVLCPPEDVEDFIAAVAALVRDPPVAEALGRNARAAVETHYTWQQHVRNLWLTVAGRPAEGYAVDRRKE